MSSVFEKNIFTVDPKQESIRLDKFLMARLYKVSRNRVQTAIKAGTIMVNEEMVKSNYKVRPGDQVSVLMPKPLAEDVRVIPDEIPLDIRYEDEDILVIYKPPGMVMHPGIGNYRRTLVNALAWYLRNQDIPVMEGNPDNRPGLVHRIDKNTSGLIVAAKNDYAMAHLAKQFFNHTIHRRYQALVWSEPELDEGTIQMNIGRHPRHRKQMTVFPEGDQGKDSITHYKVLERLYYVSLIECNLETGRTHQIRVHMKSLGHPVFNDEKYSGDRIRKGTVYTKYRQFVENCFKIIPRQALHAKELGFIHPRTEEEMFFDCELPEDMSQCLEKWRNYVNSRKQKV